MSTTANPSFSTLAIAPQWEVMTSVEFINNEVMLGNGNIQITDGGTGNPAETVTLQQNVKRTVGQTFLSDLDGYQGATAFNFRLYPNGNYKLYYCTEYSVASLSTEWTAIRAVLTRVPDPQYDVQPNPVADTTPYTALNLATIWGSEENNVAYPSLGRFDPGGVEGRRIRSIFTTRNSRTESWDMEIPKLMTEAEYNAQDLFLRQRRGRIPFTFSGYTAGDATRTFICPKWEWTLVTGQSQTASTYRFRLVMQCREIFRTK